VPVARLRSQGEYYNCPPQIFFEVSGLQDSGMERYPSPKSAAAEIYSITLKIAASF